MITKDKAASILVRHGMQAGMVDREYAPALWMVEALTEAVESAYTDGVMEGRSTQAILEIEGRDRFLKSVKADAVKPILATCEQAAVLADLMGLECLMNYHHCQETGADAMEPGAGSAHERRILELREIGRAIIAADPDLWLKEQKAAFAPTYLELQALKGAL